MSSYVAWSRYVGSLICDQKPSMARPDSCNCLYSLSAPTNQAKSITMFIAHPWLNYPSRRLLEQIYLARKNVGREWQKFPRPKRLIRQPFPPRVLHYGRNVKRNYFSYGKIKRPLQCGVLIGTARIKIRISIQKSLRTLSHKRWNIQCSIKEKVGLLPFSRD